MIPTVTVDEVLARGPCGDWPIRISEIATRYRRERWTALEILSLDEVPTEHRLWVCLHEALVPRRVLVRFGCEVASTAMRTTGWTDMRSWAALEARLAYERGEVDDAAWDVARNAAWDATWDAAWDAASAAASAAARDATWDAACSSAKAAALCAARSAARSAVWPAAGATVWAVASATAWSAQVRLLRTLLLLDLDGYDVLRGALGQPVPRRAT